MSSGADWWARKLGGVQPQGRPDYMVPRTPGLPPVPVQPSPPAPQPHQAQSLSETGLVWQGSQQGGAGETKSLGPCPNCGSNNYFSRRYGSVTTSNGVVLPAPECFECGYPKVQGTLAVPTSMTSGVTPARQGGLDAPPGSLQSLQTT